MKGIKTVLFISVFFVIITGIAQADTRPPYLECGNEKCTFLVDENGKFYTYLVKPDLFANLTNGKLRAQVERYEGPPQHYQGFFIVTSKLAYRNPPPPIKKFITTTSDSAEFKPPVLRPYTSAEVCAQNYAQDQRGQRFFSPAECFWIISK